MRDEPTGAGWKRKRKRLFMLHTSDCSAKDRERNGGGRHNFSPPSNTKSEIKDEIRKKVIEKIKPQYMR